MIEFDINWLAWIVLVVGAMMLGFAWYSKVLFGKAWQAAIGKTDDDMKAGVAGAMTTMVVLSLVLFFVLANVIHWTNETTFGGGALAGLILWLGFTFAPSMTNAMFIRRKMTAAWIEQLYYGVSIVIAGGVFAIWQ